MADNLVDLIVDHINRGIAGDVAGQVQSGQLSPADAAASYTQQTGLPAGDLFAGPQQSALAKLASDPTFASMAPQDQLTALAKLGSLGVIPAMQEMAVNRAYGQALSGGLPQPQNGSVGDTQSRAPVPQTLPGQTAAASPLANLTGVLSQGLNPGPVMSLVKTQADLGKTAADTAQANSAVVKNNAEADLALKTAAKTAQELVGVPGAPATAATGTINPLTLYTRIQGAENAQGDPKATGDGGKAVGLMQTHPAAFAEGAEYAGLNNPDPANPAHQMLAGQGYFQKQLDTFHDPVRATIAYNAGPSVAQNWDGNVQSLPEQTQAYLGKVFGPDAVPNSGAPAAPGAPALSVKAAQDVATKQAEEKATETLAAEKGVQQILSRLPSMKSKLQRMDELAPNTMSGMGVVPPQDSNESTGLKGQMYNQFDPSNPKIGNTAEFKNLNDQLFVNEIPALMNGASGMRMDIPLVKGVKSASGVPIEIPGPAKQQVIQSLKSNFDQTRDNALSYYKNLTGHDYDLGKAFQTPQDVKQAYQTGVITKEQATQLLQKNHGFQ
jgi:transglycosylase-like protein with SLT domain